MLLLWLCLPSAPCPILQEATKKSKAHHANRNFQQVNHCNWHTRLSAHDHVLLAITIQHCQNAHNSPFDNARPTADSTIRHLSGNLNDRKEVQRHQCRSADVEKQKMECRLSRRRRCGSSQGFLSSLDNKIYHDHTLIHSKADAWLKARTLLECAVGIWLV